MKIKNILLNLKKYTFLLEELIKRDFKVKYQRSALGILWSVLYPLLMMAVMAVVFSNIFKASMPGVNYLCYLQTGLVLFNFFSDATNQAMPSVVGNMGLINKVYIPKYIFPLSKCLFFNYINTFICCYIINWNWIKYPSFITSILLFNVINFLYWLWIFLISDFSIFKRHILYMGYSGTCVDLFNSYNV